MNKHFTHLVRALLALWFFAGSAFAQCDPHIIPGGRIPGINGNVLALAEWDPDGPGPLGPLTVFGGSFYVAGDVFVQNIAAWDPATRTWSKLGPGLNGNVNALCAVPGSGGVGGGGGGLYAAGAFTLAGETTVNRIARWDGQKWNALGSGIVGGGVNYLAEVFTLAVLPSGDLVAGGKFIVAGGKTVFHIAKWNGEVWESMGGATGDLGDEVAVRNLTVLTSGKLIASGQFKAINGVLARNLACWDGTAWSAMGLFQTPQVFGTAALPNGDLIIAGRYFHTDEDFTTYSGMAQWNGTTWTDLGETEAFEAAGSAFVSGPDGRVYAAYWFGRNSDIGVWDGHTWTPMGANFLQEDFSSGGAASLLVRSDGSLVAGGEFDFVSSGPAHNVAVWSAGAWSPVSRGFNSQIRAFAETPDGSLIAGGKFVTAGNVDVPYVAKWDGVEWQTMGSAIDAPVRAFAISPSGELYAAGEGQVSLTSPGGRIHRWDGEAWRPVTYLRNGAINAITWLPDGKLVAAGDFGLAPDDTLVPHIGVWNGSSWSPVGGGTSGGITALGLLSNSDVIAAGRFATAGGVTVNNIARWDGQKWNPLGTGIAGSVYAILVLPGDQIIAAGTFSTAGGVAARNIARWDGVKWNALGSGAPFTVYSLLARSSTEIVVGGSGRVAIWNSLTWSTPITTIREPGRNGVVWALHAGRGGELLLGGSFDTFGETATGYFARWATSNLPWIAREPAPVTSLKGDSVLLSATPATGYTNVHYRWYRNDLELDCDSDPGRLSVSCPVAGSLPSPTQGTPVTLNFSSIQPSDAGLYRVTFWNSCGEATSMPVEVKVKAHITDINSDGRVDDADFLLFLNQYDIMLCAEALMPDSCSADFNHDGAVDDADFGIFVPAYSAMTM